MDAIGGPLLENDRMDPTVFIDDDGQAYIYRGNPDLWYVKLNEDMISYGGDITQVPLTAEGFGIRLDNSDRNTTFEERPWIYKDNGLYYLIYAAVCCPEDIRYSTAPTAIGPWTYGGVIMPAEGASFTDHPAIINFRNSTYFFYHNGALPGGSGFTRSVAVEGFVYNSNGPIPEITMTADGPAQIQPLNTYVRQEAETIAWTEGVETVVCSEGGINISFINDGDHIKVKGVAFGDGVTSFHARVASATNGGAIELRLDAGDGTVIGTYIVPSTGGWQTWITVDCPVTGAIDTHDLFFRFVGNGTNYLLNFDWWEFDNSSKK